MFEHYTENARRVIVRASEEARRLRHDYLGAEHFLLALVRDDRSAGSRILSVLEIPPATVRRDVEQAVPARGPELPEQGHLPFTPAAKDAMELGMLEAARVNSPSIGSGHLLLGLIREGQSPAAQVLTALGADLERARDAERVVREGTEPEA